MAEDATRRPFWPNIETKIACLSMLPFPALRVVYATLILFLMATDRAYIEEKYKYPFVVLLHCITQFSIGLITRRAATRAAQRNESETKPIVRGWIAQAAAF